MLSGQSGAALLDEWIEKRQYKQLQVAGLFGISEGFVSMLRRGLRAPGRDLAIAISDETGIPVGAWSLSADDKRELVTVPTGRKARVNKR